VQTQSTDDSVGSWILTQPPEQWEELVGWAERAGVPLGPVGIKAWVPQTDQELQQWVHEHLGIWIPDKQICPDHVAPLTAFADAFFARHPRAVWKGSRGLAGKTVLLAALSLSEAILLGAGVTLLGGSGEQSIRVHHYMNGQDPALANTFWAAPNAPRNLLIGDSSKRETRLVNRGYLNALMASQASVRGPHPQRLRGDEIDEMEEAIWDAAQGQPMEAAGIAEQVVGSSTHQYPDGTMSRELQMAQERGWPVFIWCYKESMAGGWLTSAQVERKKAAVSAYMWQTEFELQEPTTQGHRVYVSFSRKENVRPVVDTGGELLIGMDFNVAPMSAVVCVRAGDELHQIDEIEIFDSGTEDMAQEIAMRYCAEKYGLAGVVVRDRQPREIEIHPDPSGSARKTSAPVGQTDFTILRRAGFRVKAPNIAPLVVDRVNEVNALALNAQGRRRLFIHPRCTKTIKCLDALPYKDNSSIIDKSLNIDHLPDALGYVVHNEFPIQRGQTGMRKVVGL
jgi:hypothetical protein